MTAPKRSTVVLSSDLLSKGLLICLHTRDALEDTLSEIIKSEGVGPRRDYAFIFRRF